MTFRICPSGLGLGGHGLVSGFKVRFEKIMVLKPLFSVILFLRYELFLFSSSKTDSAAPESLGNTHTLP